jgi:hypothetical protein
MNGTTRRRLTSIVGSLVIACVTVASASAGCDDEKTGETVRLPDATSELTPTPGDTGGPSICPASSFTYKEDDVTRFLGGEFKSPKAAPGACSPTEIDAFDKNLRSATSSTPVTDLKKGLADPCATCLFSTTTSETWQIVLSITGGAPTDFIVNFGACHAALETTTPQTCGRAVLYDALCARAACKDCEPSATESCLQKVRASAGACFAVHDAITKACPSFPKTQPKCGTTAAQHATVLCGSPASDAGIDSGIVDAGDGG